MSIVSRMMRERCESLESVGLCTSSGVRRFLTTFGSGSPDVSAATPGNFNFSTSYTQRWDGNTGVSDFVFLRYFNGRPSWHTIVTDHTVNETNGYLMLVDVAETPSFVYRRTVDRLCVGERYEFSVYLANLFPPSFFPKPTVLFEVRDATTTNKTIAQYSSGDLMEYWTFTWEKFGISFISSVSSVSLWMTLNETANFGNDMVMDDIEFRTCSIGTTGIC
jgi:hypothetical protein